MDSLVIERSLAILEDRYRELRKIGEQQFESFEGELAALRGELEVVKEEKAGIEGELEVVKEEKAGIEGELEVVKEEKAGIEGELEVVKEEKAGIEGELEVVREEKAGIEGELEVVKEEKAGIEGELEAAREEADLCLLQLNQAQEELNHYSLQLRVTQESYQLLLEECALKDEKLHWLRGQRLLLIGLIKYQTSVFQRFTAISVRLTRALNSERDVAKTSGPWLLYWLKVMIPGSRRAVKQIHAAPLD